MIPPRRSKAHTRAHPSCPAPSWSSEGAGHTSMYVASTCAERVKRDYLFSGHPARRGYRLQQRPFAI